MYNNFYIAFALLHHCGRAAAGAWHWLWGILASTSDAAQLGVSPVKVKRSFPNKSIKAKSELRSFEVEFKRLSWYFEGFRIGISLEESAE